MTIRLSPRAEAQVDALIAHYERLGRLAATRNLLVALEMAALRIETSPFAGLPAPRPYPTLAKAGRLWLHAGSYWVAYTITEPAVIQAVIHDTANIPRRL
ncbi:type II toxin-antitoxin system RelE/ParE family toxin [Nitrospirillum sp. BR 11164]|uniref:type II toxin-antitoxin system RelE/ParE family toxin n=1 Tax=Nitrospirillum sp. BR 11164 TaxID=3104324 RepID=UPI002AFFFCEC|nr:type II toxin-antitoxin system RelE/ParE family toxin [Nitrospirillum sp. BR 11164]MEA1650211.1 type II toxin-antitoxin system RelE/ParE family toxin [Nitrospirillum sp. BR 11164]